MSWSRLGIERETDFSIFTDTMVEMTWLEVEDEVKNNSIVLLPIGIIEEHGPHMDLSPDAYIAYLFCKYLKKKLLTKNLRAIIAPPFYWGVSNDVKKYPGTFSVRPETMKSLLIDIYTSLDSWGFKNIFIVNSHGDGTHKEMIRKSNEETKESSSINVYNLETLDVSVENPPLFPKPREGRYQPDYHAGAIETACMYTFYPHKVNVDVAKELKPQNSFHPLGYCGDPSNFDLEKDIIEYFEADLENDSLKIDAVLRKKD